MPVSLEESVMTNLNPSNFEPMGTVSEFSFVVPDSCQQLASSPRYNT